MTEALRAGQMPRIRQRYRRSTNVLILEDVQFLAGKRATQVELFHTLDHLMSHGRTVVLSADRPPSELDELDPKLVLAHGVGAGRVHRAARTRDATRDPARARRARGSARSRRVPGAARHARARVGARSGRRTEPGGRARVAARRRRSRRSWSRRRSPRSSCRAARARSRRSWPRPRARTAWHARRSARALAQAEPDAAAPDRDVPGAPLHRRVAGRDRSRLLARSHQRHVRDRRGGAARSSRSRSCATSSRRWPSASATRRASTPSRRLAVVLLVVLAVLPRFDRLPPGAVLGVPGDGLRDARGEIRFRAPAERAQLRGVDGVAVIVAGAQSLDRADQRLGPVRSARGSCA